MDFDSFRTRSPVLAENGIVATSQPLAAQVGLDILKSGGNAVDAAIATNAVLGVVEPMMCGMGGDLFAIVWDGQQLHGLNASGHSPYAANLDTFKGKGWKEIPARHPYAWSVPGCVKGWETLHKKFGTLPFDRLLAPAIQYAEKGFGVSDIIAEDWKGSESTLAATPNAKRTYLPNGHAPTTGERFTNVDLAKTYRLIADKGPGTFYKGSIAERIIAYSEKHDGLLTMRDFAEHDSTWVKPLNTNYRGYDVYELPPNTQGIAALQMLNILEQFDIKAMGHNSPDFLHLFIEAKKLAFSDRAKFYADPEVERDLPTLELISAAYAEQQRKRLNPNKAALNVPPGNVRPIEGDTIYLTAADNHGNVISFIQSTYYAFGSGHVPGDLGFTLQNRGMLFALEADHPNCIKPHKRPFHTIIPAMVMHDGKPWLSFGVMGGDMQPQGHVQILTNMIDHSMNVQQAGDAPRVRHYGSSTPTGRIMTDGGQVIVEAGISDEAIAALNAKGHRVKVGRRAFGGYQGIFIDPETNLYHGGSDPRKDGCAIGY